MSEIQLKGSVDMNISSGTIELVSALKNVL